MNFEPIVSKKKKTNKQINKQASPSLKSIRIEKMFFWGLFATVVSAQAMVVGSDFSALDAVLVGVGCRSNMKCDLMSFSGRNCPTVEGTAIQCNANGNVVALVLSDQMLSGYCFNVCLAIVLKN